MRTRAILIRLMAAGMFALLVLLLIPRLRGPEQLPAPPYWPTEGWRSSSPEDQSIDSAKLADALLTMRDKNIQIHSLLLIRNGSAVVDAHFYPYDGTTVHDVASVTKSLMTTLIGIAADQGKLRLDQPMLSFFPERTIANRDARKERITVRHLASMSSGLACTSEGDEATLKEMLAAPNWVQFALDRKVLWEPGTHFIYCSSGMHLLSAVLQQATGKTALEFARENLFEPLDIREVIWPTDPQGASHGWGDIRLHPRDMAKIGYLWLNRGAWEGRQVVSSKWVDDSVKPQIRTGDDDDYGYGWWVSTAQETGEFSSYRADGRGGQYVVVVPTQNLILVTTGGGFGLDQVAPLLIQAFVDTSKPLPANPEGVARLDAAVRAIAQAPQPRPVAPLPKMARVISGRTFAFGANPARMKALRFEFNTSATAIVHVTLAGTAQPRRWPVGLDGVHRMSKGEYGSPEGLRGYWADAKTFVLEYDGITNNDHITFRMRFEGDRLMVEGQETAHELGVRFEGRIQHP